MCDYQRTVKLRLRLFENYDYWSNMGMIDKLYKIIFGMSGHHQATVY